MLQTSMFYYVKIRDLIREKLGLSWFVKIDSPLCIRNKRKIGYLEVTLNRLCHPACRLTLHGLQHATKMRLDK